MATKKAVREDEVQEAAAVEQEPTAFYATADFRIDKLNLTIEKGKRFQIPAGWMRDHAAEEILSAERRKKGEVSPFMVFTYPGEIINPGEKNPELRERRTHTAVLPLEAR